METIYSIGDAHFLYTVLNGLVMIVSAPDFLMTIKIGFTIGTFYLVLQGLMAGKFPAFQHLLLSLIIYSALFGLPTNGMKYKGIDVDIYDVYTDTNRKVDNVPFGIALTASMLSTLIWKLTETFEQAFHTTDASKLTRNGYLSSLTRLMEARSTAMKQFQQNPALAQSWRNYIKECTLIGIDLKFKSVNDVFHTGDVMTALEFPSEVFGTLIYRNGQPISLTCTEAFTWLKPQLTAWFDQQLLKDNTSPHRNLTLGSALQALSQSAESSRNFMMASALLPVYHDATIEKLQDMQQPQAAIMTQQAILQRNTQWAGEQHLFLSSMRAMMAYIEGFVFAVTPLMGLLVCVGLFGVRLAFKYLMLLLWIQLWMPVLSINNLYITLVSKGAMASLSAPITSFTGIIESGPILEYWLGVGGLMAASTPALVLMLLYGSAITATHLAGRMQSGDFVNEKVSAPDIMMPGSAVNQQAGWNIGPQQGATRGQIDQVVPALSASNQLSSLVASKDSARQSAGMAFSQATSHAFQQRYGESVDAKEFSQFSNSLSSGQSQVTQFRNDLSRDLQNRFGLSSQISKDLASEKTLNVGAHGSQSIKSTPLGMGINYRKSASGTNKESQSDSIGEALSYLNNEGLSKTWDSQLQKAMKMDAGSGQSHSWMQELGVNDNQQYQQSAQEALSSEKSFEQASQLQQLLGQALSSGPAVWAHKLAASPEAMKTLQNKPFDSDYQKDVNANYQRFETQFASSDETLAAAMVTSSLKTGDDKDITRLGAALDQAGLMTTSSEATPRSNQSLERSNTGSELQESVTGILKQPQTLDQSQAEQNIRRIKGNTANQRTLSASDISPEAMRNPPAALRSFVQDHADSSDSVAASYQQSSQYKSYVSDLMKKTAFGNTPSSTGKGIQKTSSQAFTQAKEQGLTDTQAMMFSSMVKDRDPRFERSADSADRAHRLGQAISEVSRGWGEQGATLGWHAFNHLSHAADNPQYTATGLKLVGEMNRLYQPELKQYDQSVSEMLNGQSLYPMEGNYLDTSMKPEHIGSSIRKTLQTREEQNNEWLFQNKKIGLYQDSESDVARFTNDIKNGLKGFIKPN